MNKDEKVNLFVIVPLLLTVILVGLGVTYALFTKTISPDKNITVGTGVRYIGIYGEGKNNVQVGNTYTFTIENRGVVDSGYEVYLVHDPNNTLSPENVTCNATLSSLSLTASNTQVTANETSLVTGNLKVGEKDNLTIEFTGDSSLIYKGKLRIRYVDYSTIDSPKNENIVAIYAYNQTVGAENYCVTGDESTCVYSKCYKNEKKGSCGPGTIVKYKVNDSDIVNFHVMFDEGNTLTMQSQRNTISNVAWYKKEDSVNDDNTKGPVTVLSVLENATSGWSNVNNQTYTLGTTSLSEKGFYTGCKPYNSCVKNTYTLPERTAKARLITMQEAVALGCTNARLSCPIWMYNYLKNSTAYSGTVNDESALVYWTSSAESSYMFGAWIINSADPLGYTYSYSKVDSAARAVVVIPR